MARMLGKSSQRPLVYGVGTGRTKKCFGCPDGCGYAADNGTQRTREKRATALEAAEAVLDRNYDNGRTPWPLG